MFQVVKLAIDYYLLIPAYRKLSEQRETDNKS